ncbi:MAG TPA: hypothetical protein VFR09_05270, partial [Alphaproteobacteria bacterium]|nr:hypothetical protein [Alphaproteobacteria bacterium]
MKYGLAAVGLLSAALVLAPVGQASAEPWHHGGFHGGGGWHDHYHGGYHGGGGVVAGAVGGILGAAVALAAAPF